MKNIFRPVPLAVFLSSFLLFLVQPLISQALLPWFGGGIAVWATAMVFFQTMLLLGYAYAHLLTKTSTRNQLIIHAVFIIAALFFLPILPDADLKPFAGQNPAWQMLLVLTLSIGLPYFLLSSTAPLLQAWQARLSTQKSPYKLYAVSNAASLLALFAYPLAVQPLFALSWQSWIWTTLFLTFLLTLTGVARTLLRQEASPQEPLPVSPRPRWFHLLRWVFLSFVGSAFSLAVTNQLTLDIAPTPFLWILPLAVYLLTFMLVFGDDIWYERNIMAGIYAFLLFGVLATQASGARLPTIGILVTNLVLLFCGCMLCHGELAKTKPAADRLTIFYLALALGGALGGVFVAIAAPYLFSGYWELPIVELLALLVALSATIFRKESLYYFRKKPLTTFSALCVVVGMAAVQQASVQKFYMDVTLVQRNLYGILRVKEHDAGTELHRRELLNGSTLHGVQFVAEDKKQLATSYYGSNSGLGKLMGTYLPDNKLHLGVVGLGTGNTAVYGDENDRLAFFEIDADVIRIASEQFTYLSDSKAEITIELGDARLTLERSEPLAFDVLAIDAFTSDAIPTHLLTIEAFQQYVRHLKENGVLAVHISNRHLDLQPVIAAASEALSMPLRFVRSDASGIESGSTWALISRDEARLNAIETAASGVIPSRLWTDSYSSILPLIQ